MSEQARRYSKSNPKGLVSCSLIYISRCCNAEVALELDPLDMTFFAVCPKCHKACEADVCEPCLTK